MLHRGTGLPDNKKTLMIKRYASRRLYNTETSDYVTLEDIARIIHSGRDVQILDLKSGDDLTRQYLLQIIAEHESRGESVLPIDILTDLVRSYTTQATSIVPQFLEMSFQMLREGREKLIEKTSINSTVPDFGAIKAKQEAFLAASNADRLPLRFLEASGVHFGSHFGLKNVCFLLFCFWSRGFFV